MFQLPFTTFDEALFVLGQMQPRESRYGLDRMFLACELLGVPRGGAPAFFHVAGTNGKGSTTAFVQSLLISQGFQTGAYFSPYVFSVCERVQVNRGLIGREEFMDLIGEVWRLSQQLESDHHGGLTEFEAKTLIGFRAWQHHRCEAVALEVGIGGRLDATNVVAPTACLITSIGMDHMHILGDTLAKIAAEKAGIIKPGVPVMVGELPAEATEVVRRVAQERGAPAWFLGEELRVIPGDGEFSVHTPKGVFEGLTTRLAGTKNPGNAALAIGSLAASGFIRDPGQIREGIAKAWLPGRLQEVTSGGRTYVMDGGHNEEAALVIADSVRQNYPNRQVALLVGMNEGHSAEPFLRNLAGVSTTLATITMKSPRTRRGATLAKLAAEFFDEVRAFDSVEEAVATLDAEVVVVAGSFYLMSEVVQALGLEPETLSLPPA